MQLTRRKALAGISSAVVGGIALTTLPDDAQGTQIDVQEIEVPDATQEVSNPVTSAQLTVSGEYTVDSETLPDRVICRLEAKRATNEAFEQLEAAEPEQSLDKEFTEEFTFEGNLLDIPDVSAPELTPDDVGDMSEIEIDVRLRLVVKKGATVLNEVSVEDTATVTVEKTLGDVKIGLDATGNMTVSD
jgi:hypothetical protein